MPVKISECNNKPIIVPCSLKDFNYQVDPYVGCEHYCKYCYVLNQAETDWTREVLIHKDLTSRLSRELEKIEPQKIYMGYYSDPYQACEKEYYQTRNVLALLHERGFSASILTKSDLVVRDIDIISQMNDASVSVSVAFNDNKTRKLFEANTINTENRIKALKELKKTGVKTSALLCPVIPFITDVKPLIEMLETCTEQIWIYSLSILSRSEVSWQNVESILNDNFADMADEIEDVIFNKEHQYWIELRQELAELQKTVNVKLNIHV